MLSQRFSSLLSEAAAGMEAENVHVVVRLRSLSVQDDADCIALVAEDDTTLRCIDEGGMLRPGLYEFGKDKLVHHQGA